MNRPTIAVVIPNRNDAGPLRTCLDSVRELPRAPDEIIVVDDQSTDDSVAVIRAMIADLPRARLVLNESRLGTMGALNVGLRQASADYVLFLSSNDYLAGDIFGHAGSVIERDGWPGVWSAMVIAEDAEGNRTGLYPSPVVARKDTHFSATACIRLAQRLGHWFTGTTLIYRRQALVDIGGFDTAYRGMADMLAALTIASIRGASFSPAPFGIMRQHAGGLMWRTLVDLDGLDRILARLAVEGPRLSPALFTREFLDLFERRVRFTAIRAFPNRGWVRHARSWIGGRYRLLVVFAPTAAWSRKLMLGIVFVLLRPPQDLWHIVRYRLLPRWQLRDRELRDGALHGALRP